MSNSASFDKRWGIADVSRQTQRAQNQLLNMLDELSDLTYQQDHIRRAIGERVYSHANDYAPIDAPPFQVEFLEDHLDNSIELAERLEAMLNVAINVWGIDDIKEVIDHINANSSIFGLNIIQQNEEYITFPAGAEILDKGVVVKNLQNLPEVVNNEYEQALKKHAEGNSSESVDKTRRALEEMLRSLFENRRGLQSNLGELKQWLKQKDLPDGVIEVITTTASLLDRKDNDLTKHASAEIDETIAEYFIYKVGSLLRLLSRLDKEK